MTNDTEKHEPFAHDEYPPEDDLIQNERELSQLSTSKNQMNESQLDQNREHEIVDVPPAETSSSCEAQKRISETRAPKCSILAYEILPPLSSDLSGIDQTIDVPIEVIFTLIFLSLNFLMLHISHIFSRILSFLLLLVLLVIN